MLVCMLSFRRRLYHNGCIANNACVSRFVSWDHGKGRHFFVFVPTRHSMPCGSTFQLSPGLPRKFLYQKFAFIHCCVRSSVKSPSHWSGPAKFGVTWTHENTASSLSCLQRASTTQHVPMQHLFYSLVWMSAKWTSSGSNGSFYLGHQTCVCC